MIDHHNLSVTAALDHILPKLSPCRLQPLETGRLVEEVEHRQLGRRRQLANGQHRAEIFLHQRHLKVHLVVLEHVVLGADVRSGLHVVRGEAHLVGEVGVQADVPSEIHEVDEELLPRRLPAVGPRPGNLDGVLLGVLGEPRPHVRVELPPVLGEEDCSPAAWELVEVWSVGVDVLEELGGIPFGPLLHHLDESWGVQGDGGELGEGDLGVVVVRHERVLDPYVVVWRHLDVIF